MKLKNHKTSLKMHSAEDILNLAGKFAPKKKKLIIKAREEMEKKYKRF